MKTHNTCKDFNEFHGADVFSHGHLPIAASFCRRLGLVELVNKLVPSKMILKPGTAVLSMVLDTLSGRTPLYRVKDFMTGQDRELLLGEAVPATMFNDTNLARSLDAIFEAGSSKIITELGIRASEIFQLDSTIPSYDTTSTSLWGDYRSCESDKPKPGPVITHGHSKDGQPQLKQFMTELLCVDRGIPIFGKTLDGNSSDKTSNNTILTRISSIMSKHGLGSGAFVYVADSAMVTEKNLEKVGKNLFISRLPATYAECQRAISQAVTAKTWIDIGKLAETTTGSSRPCANYKTFETTVELHNKTYRAVVVHSSSHDKRRQNKLDKTVANSVKSIDSELKKLATVYFCEADAKAAAKHAENLSGKLHTVKASVCALEVRKPGRPPIDKLTPTNTRYKLSCNIVENPIEIDKERSIAGCFVLLTNVPIKENNAMDGKKLLQTYKGQYCVESDFAFLKDPLIVNDIFLKTPSRIDALAMILIISLMIWRLMERSMRLYVQNTKTMLPGWRDRNTDKPTSFMMATAIVGIMVISIGKQRKFLREPNDRHLAFLTALGLTSSVFLDPNCKCQVITPLNLVK